MGMNQVLEHAPGAREMQIVQEKLDEITVRVVPDPSFGESDRRALTREFRRRLGDGMKIQFVEVDRIERLSNGKFKAVVCLL